MLRKDLGLGLDLLTDALRRPAFPDTEFERKRDEVRASVRRSEEDPGTVAARVLRRLVFPGHPYGRPVTGTEASLGAITRGDVVAFQEKTAKCVLMYALDRAVLPVDTHVHRVAERLGFQFAQPLEPPIAPSRHGFRSTCATAST